MSGISRDRRNRRLARPSGLLIAGLLAALALAGGRFGPAAAQDATPAATPAATCTPAVGDGDMGGMDMGATPAASPVADEEPIGTPADEATAAAVVAAAENLVACYNSDPLAFLDLVTDHFITEVVGYGDREAAAATIVDDVATNPLTLSLVGVDAGSALTYDDGRVSVDVAYFQGPYQYVEARWFFVQSGSDWLADDEGLLVPEPDVDFVTIISASVAADEGATVVFDQSTSVPATDAIVIHLINNSATDRGFAVVMLPEGTTLNEDGTLPEGLADVDSVLATEGAALVGFIDVAAGGIEDMALVGLPPGVYVLVDTSDGTLLPLTVTAPAA
jgi:hypothetical protein